MPRYILSRYILTLVVLTLSITQLANASELYSLDSAITSNSSIYRLNQTTGAEALVGPVGPAFAFPGDLTSDTHLGTFRIWSPDITNNNLIKIDPTTGAGSVVGPFSTPGGAVKMVSLAFDPVTSTMYGNTALSFNGSPDRLFRIDPSTGASVPIGDIGFNDVFALGFSQAGKLYGVSNAAHQLLLIDTTLGSGGAIGPVTPQSVFDLATRPEDGAAFIVDSGTTGVGTNSLYRLDLNTGGTGLIGPHTATHNMVGLAFGPVPEPATFTLFAFAATLLTLRRKR
ncbi:MAG TPA: PEP-CTERM sorting domain-containing protein [Tepidisphaeraceae bacterium]|jgi:hypothetical protein|nr:PEP-CTERM sorting domain-containing protein [Tepidisphaeraceae bacterium]